MHMFRICLTWIQPYAIKVAQFSLAAGLVSSITTAQSKPVYTSIKSIDTACKSGQIKACSADADEDTIPDEIDQCPDDAEDLDDYVDFDGCPDRDNDGDHVPDSVDDCPNIPETVNGVDDLDGCPDWNWSDTLKTNYWTELGIDLQYRYNFTEYSEGSSGSPNLPASQFNQAALGFSLGPVRPSFGFSTIASDAGSSIKTPIAWSAAIVSPVGLSIGQHRNPSWVNLHFAYNFDFYLHGSDRTSNQLLIYSGWSVNNRIYSCNQDGDGWYGDIAYSLRGRLPEQTVLSRESLGTVLFSFGYMFTNCSHQQDESALRKFREARGKNVDFKSLAKQDDAKQLTKSCSEGNFAACTKLGKAARTGNVATRDLESSANLFELACTGGQPEACFELGKSHREGTGVERDMSRASSSFEKACELGHADGCLELALALHVGRGLAADRTRAAMLLNSSCEDQSGTACRILGYRFLKGEFVEKDLERANRLFEFACKHGDRRGCCELGRSHLTGRGVAKNTSAGTALIEKACASGKGVCCPNKE